MGVAVPKSRRDVCGCLSCRTLHASCALKDSLAVSEIVHEHGAIVADRIAVCILRRERRCAVSSSEFPTHVRDLLARCIRSVSQLEVLLLLMRESGSEWTAERTSAELYIQPQPAADHLSKLHSSGLIEKTGDDRYRYAPRSNDVDRAVRDLARIYGMMRLRVINEIMSNPDDSIQSFADAFKLRKDKE